MNSIWFAATAVWILGSSAMCCAAELEASQTKESSGCDAAFLNRDFVAARELCRPLAEMGDSDAQYKLGEMYKNGDGGSENYFIAAEWFRKSAAKGNVNSEDKMGDMYKRGWGVPQNEEIAVMWYRKSAEKGNLRAQGNLGFMYFLGIGVGRDLLQSYKWYILSSTDGDSFLSSMRDTVRSGLNDSEIREAHKWASEWRPK
jgi:TPR repeat protein